MFGGLDPAALVRQLALTLIPMVLSLTVHEFSHALVATRLGDGTARGQGRLTLNPAAHIDPIGTLILPAVSVVMGGIAFLGWAKPVPCRPDRFREGVPPRLGLALVSAAGPLSNVVLALLALGALAVLVKIGVPLHAKGAPTSLAVLLYSTFTLNVGLALFNLLPIPPLDGHRLLPKVFDPVVRPLERYGFGALLVVFMFLPRAANAVFFGPVKSVQTWLLHAFGFGG
jgi:Zn-dependent protease